MKHFGVLKRGRHFFSTYLPAACRDGYHCTLIFLDILRTAPHDIAKMMNVGRYLRCKKIIPGVSMKEYLCYRFFTMPPREWRTFLLKSEYPFQSTTMNKTITHYFRKKDLFLERYAPYIHRSWAKTNSISYEKFMQFCSMHPSFVYKPLNLTGGRGIELCHIFAEKDVADYYHKIKNSDGIIEEMLTAHPQIAALHPSSLNTIRVVTISNATKAEILYAFIRVGKGASVVDNLSSGGLGARINGDTGVIEDDAFDAYVRRYPRHPDSHILFKGFTIPGWELVKKTCLEACSSRGDYGIIGWDVAVLSNERIELIEGNSEPYHDYILQCSQKPGYLPMLYAKIIEYYGHTYDEDIPHP